MQHGQKEERRVASKKDIARVEVAKIVRVCVTAFMLYRPLYGHSGHIYFVVDINLLIDESTVQMSFTRESCT